MSEAAATKPSVAKSPIAKSPVAGPFSMFERMVAWRYLRSRRKETVISVIASISFLGIMLGVATLIVVMAVMNGFRAELLTRILGVNGHLIVQPLDSPLEDYAQVAARINGVAGVKYAIPLIDGQVLAQGNVGGGMGALVRGIRAEDLGKIAIVANNVKQGSLADFDSGEGVAIGKRMAENLGLVLGDTITLISPEGDVTPMGTTPRMKGYKVAAIFEVGMSEYDSSIVYMPFSEAQLYFNMDGRAQTIEIYVDNPDDVDALKPLVDRHGRLAPAQRDVLFSTSGRAQRHVHDPDADRAGGGAQHHLRPDHAGEGQGPRHRHPAHHGGDPCRGDAHLLHHRRQHRHRRYARRPRARRSRLPQH
jgi:lipoprotein-releasing system permease protein